MAALAAAQSLAQQLAVPKNNRNIAKATRGLRM